MVSSERERLLSPDRVFGILSINKPSGPTSHDIVAIVRRGTGLRKVGHAGTLDPMASGVLVLCLGPATRLSEYAMRSTKRYRALVRLGATTDTYDAEGEIVAETPLDDLTIIEVEAALAQFRGEIEQIPPMYSAIKKSGKKLYELARAGETIEREPRRVTISELTLTDSALPDITLEVACSPGTYIRSLAHDLGEALGVGAHLTGLVRVASGSFHVNDAVTLGVLQRSFETGAWREYLLAPDTALRDLPAVHLDEEQAARVQHGNTVPAPDGVAGQHRAYAPDGELLAILDAQGGRWRAVKVFPS